ncbi:MAG: sporulation protein YqfD [Halanaerobiaceae bacterium]
MIYGLVRFFRGYLLVAVYGNALERFISQLIEAGIVLWDVERIADDYYRIKLNIDDFNKLRPILRKRMCRVEVLCKCGFPFLLQRARRRVFFVFGLVLFFIFLWLASSFVWFIEFQGLEDISRDELMSTLQQCGIERGDLKRNINLSELEEELVIREPGISWLDARWQGTKLEIEIVEKKTVEKQPAGDIIAARDGIITELIVLKGRPIVQEGDTVAAGQKLIMEPEKGTGAKGIVRAYVWYEEEAGAELKKEEPVYTGRSSTLWKLGAGGRKLTLNSFSRPNYDKYVLEKDVKTPREWRNLHFPVEIIIEEYKEVKVLHEKRDRETAIFLAREKALKQVLSRLSPGAVIQNSRYEISEEEQGNTVKVDLLVKVEENIAQKEDISD